MTIANRPRLGRGLKSLISTPEVAPPISAPVIMNVPAEQAPKGPESLKKIPLELIDPNPDQPRHEMDAVALEELVASVKANGILQPVMLRAAGGRFQLVAGHRRTEAAKKAGLTEISAIVRSDTTDEKQAEWALIENIHRADLNPIERARAYRTYMTKFETTQNQLATRLGEDRASVANYLRLLDLASGVQDLVARGLLSLGHAKVLAGISDLGQQNSLANRCIKENLSVRKLEELAAQVATPADESAAAGGAGGKSLAAKSAHILDLEQDLSRKLGTKLRITPSRKKNTGKIVIQYFSLDEFDRIVECFEHAKLKKE